jgi:hypothetical protein
MIKRQMYGRAGFALQARPTGQLTAEGKSLPVTRSPEFAPEPVVRRRAGGGWPLRCGRGSLAIQVLAHLGDGAARPAFGPPTYMRHQRLPPLRV